MLYSISYQELWHFDLPGIIQSNAKEIFTLFYNYTHVKMCAVGPPICQIACEWKRPEADFDRGLTSLVQPSLSILNISHKINNSDNALASLACLSLMSIVLSNELVDNIISNKNKKLTYPCLFPCATCCWSPLSRCCIVMVTSCISHRC